MAARALAMLAVLAVGACAHEPQPQTCSNLTINDAVAAMGAEVLAQPVFAGGGTRGYRLYGTWHSAQLTTHAIKEGALMTQVCGVPANEIFAQGGQICCVIDASSEFEVTFLINGKETRIRIKR